MVVEVVTKAFKETTASYQSMSLESRNFNILELRFTR